MMGRLKRTLVEATAFGDGQAPTFGRTTDRNSFSHPQPTALGAIDHSLIVPHAAASILKRGSSRKVGRLTGVAGKERGTAAGFCELFRMRPADRKLILLFAAILAVMALCKLYPATAVSDALTLISAL